MYIVKAPNNTNAKEKRRIINQQNAYKTFIKKLCFTDHNFKSLDDLKLFSKYIVVSFFKSLNIPCEHLYNVILNFNSKSFQLINDHLEILKYLFKYFKNEIIWKSYNFTKSDYKSFEKAVKFYSKLSDENINSIENFLSGLYNNSEMPTAKMVTVLDSFKRFNVDKIIHSNSKDAIISKGILSTITKNLHNPTLDHVCLIVRIYDNLEKLELENGYFNCNFINILIEDEDLWNEIYFKHVNIEMFKHIFSNCENLVLYSEDFNHDNTYELENIIQIYKEQVQNLIYCDIEDDSIDNSGYMSLMCFEVLPPETLDF